MATTSNQIYNLVSNYVSSEIELTNSQIRTAANNCFDNLENAHSNNNLNTTSQYDYYNNLSLVTDTALGINSIPNTLRAKIKSANSIFNFKNTVDNKYIMVNNQKAFRFANVSDWQNGINLYNWTIANNVYGSQSSSIQTQYNSNFNQIVQNQEPL